MQAKPLFLLALALGVGCALATDTLCPTYTVKSGDGLYQIVAAGNNTFTQDQLIATLQQFIGYTDTTVLQVNEVIPLPGYTAGCQYVIHTDPTWCLAYQVQANDTLTSIAASLNTTVEAIIGLNEDVLPASNVPKQGTYLRLPGWNQNECADPQDTVAACQVYTVKAGDSITSIASLYELDVAELEKLNNLTDTSTLAPNKRLYFPPWTSKCNNVTNQKTAVLPSGTAKACRVAQLQSGEGLYALAQQYGKTLDDLYAANPGLTNQTLLTLGAIIHIDSLCACTSVVLVGNGTLPSNYAIDKSGCNSAPAPAPAPATVALAPAPVLQTAAAPTPAPAAAAHSPAQAPVSEPTLVTAHAPQLAVSTVSGAAGLGPQLMVVLALVAGMVAIF